MKLTIGSTLIDVQKSGFKVSVELVSKVMILFSDSGVGKTFLFDCLRSYCITHGLKYGIMTYSLISNKGIDELRVFLSNFDVIMLNEADLYMTTELYKLLKELDAISLVELHRLILINDSDVKLVEVSFNENEIELRNLKL